MVWIWHHKQLSGLSLEISLSFFCQLLCRYARQHCSMSHEGESLATVKASLKGASLGAITDCIANMVEDSTTNFEMEQNTSYKCCII